MAHSSSKEATIPRSKINDFCQPPLHMGALGGTRILRCSVPQDDRCWKAFSLRGRVAPRCRGQMKRGISVCSSQKFMSE